ncbi:hypothetical protein KLEP7_gp88 [Pseudaeromonas phage vB_PpeM_ KLEP7]|nr:hypothetical protein KLEP7_gp88 [Pseudaeromonas phage vB_PpeM_ KLEP7]
MTRKNLVESKVKGLAVEIVIDWRCMDNEETSKDIVDEVWNILYKSSVIEPETCFIDDHLTIECIVMDMQHKSNLVKEIKKMLSTEFKIEW